MNVGRQLVLSYTCSSTSFPLYTMHIPTIFLTNLLFSCFSDAHGGTGFRFNYFNLTKKIGETFETECVMDNFRRYQDAVNIKKMVFESGNPHVVGTNGMINSEFQNGRFSASFDLSPSNTAIFKLTINRKYMCGYQYMYIYIYIYIYIY